MVTIRKAFEQMMYTWNHGISLPVNMNQTIKLPFAIPKCPKLELLAEQKIMNPSDEFLKIAGEYESGIVTEKSFDKLTKPALDE